MVSSPWSDVLRTHKIQYDLDLWPQGQFKGIVLWFHVRDAAFLRSFDIVIPYLGHESLTLRRCITTIYDLWMTLALYQGDIFTHELVSGKDSLCSLIWAYQTWHLNVPPWDNSCVVSWPLNDLRPINGWGEYSWWGIHVVFYCVTIIPSLKGACYFI